MADEASAPSASQGQPQSRGGPTEEKADPKISGPLPPLASANRITLWDDSIIRGRKPARRPKPLPADLTQSFEHASGKLSYWRRLPYTAAASGALVLIGIASQTITAVPGNIWGVATAVLGIPAVFKDYFDWRKEGH